MEDLRLLIALALLPFDEEELGDPDALLPSGAWLELMEARLGFGLSGSLEP
jgi:hypothetical protein